MLIRKPKPFDLVGGAETPEGVVVNRRRWLKLAGLGTAAGTLAVAIRAGWKRFQGTDEEVTASGTVVSDYEQRVSSYYPAPRDKRFRYGRSETDRAEAARYTNFYEFSRFKYCWRYVDQFEPYPWQVAIDGLCRNPVTLDLEELLRRYARKLVERQYRHRCVERWAMAVPWTGIPLAAVLADVDPLPQATHVRFSSFVRQDQAPHQADCPEFPWPYAEGLTLPEAMNELCLLSTGMYGQPLLKQHGAPIRLVVPWKYGFKSIKSIQQIELVDYQPNTFWTTLNPQAYPFEANVEPDVPRPWPQDQERMLGTGEVYPTQIYNGYGNYVAHLYQA